MPLAAVEDSSTLTDGTYFYYFFIQCTTLCGYATARSGSWRTLNIDLTSVTEIGNYVVDYASGPTSIQADTYNPQDNEMLRRSSASYYVSGSAVEEYLNVGYN